MRFFFVNLKFFCKNIKKKCSQKLLTFYKKGYKIKANIFLGGVNMLSTLHIKNIGIIEDLSIDFNKGLNVLTGETGAGKTLIIDSLGIISGGRFSKDMIRKGETNSFVELCMYVPGSNKSEDGNIIVSREININGKNMCKINGRMVTVNELKDFMKEFIEIHGQNDNQNLLDSKKHLNYLDSYSGENLSVLKKEYGNYYFEYKDVLRKLKENFGDEKEKPNIIIDDFCNKSLDEDIKNLIVHNIITMKKF